MVLGFEVSNPQRTYRDNHDDCFSELRLRFGKLVTRSFEKNFLNPSEVCQVQ
jgi:hypothetical protein